MFIWKGEQINVKKSYVLSAFLVYSLGLLFLFFMPSGLNSEETGQYLILFFFILLCLNTVLCNYWG